MRKILVWIPIIGVFLLDVSNEKEEDGFHDAWLKFKVYIVYQLVVLILIWMFYILK